MPIITQYEKRGTYKMAEVLIKDFDFSLIDHIVVFNEHYKLKVKEILDRFDIKEQPKLDYQPIEGNFFYFTKFTMKDRENENLVTGPKSLKKHYDSINLKIKKARKKVTSYTCKTVSEFLKNLDSNFCFISETKGIFKLKTKNDVHTCTVSEHTLQVVDNIRSNGQFKKLKEHEQEILLLAAYLHDIGKGPHEKWPDQIQPSYPDHPLDSLLQSERVLTEDIEILSVEDIRLLTLLITYHDILGDLTRGFRNTIELKNIITSEKDLNLLYILSQADILAIRKDWHKGLIENFEEIKNKVLK